VEQVLTTSAADPSTSSDADAGPIGSLTFGQWAATGVRPADGTDAF